MNKEEQEFFNSCLAMGMEDGSNALAIAMRAFKRWRSRGPLKENDLRNVADYDDPGTCFPS